MADPADDQARFANGGDPTCPYCHELVSEDEGLEGPHGNLWHQRCLDAWREDDHG